MDDDLTTDACPSPPRDEQQQEDVEEAENTPKPVKPERKQRSESHAKSRKQRIPKPKAAFTNYSIINSNNVHLGTNLTVNINSCDKPKETNRDVIKTDQIRQLLDCAKPVQREHIIYISGYIGTAWKDIARHLDYSDGQIDQFYTNHHVIGMKEVIYQMLLDWIQVRADDATLKILANTLWDCEQKDAVRKLAKKIYS